MKTLIATALSVLCLLAPAWAQEADAPLAPRIVCDEPVHDFGSRENSGVVEHAYTIRNDGALTLEILGVRATCGCTAVTPEDTVIPPGASTKVVARFDLRGRTGMQIKTIFVQSNDPKTPTLNLQLRGTATQALRAQPSSLFYGRVDAGAAHSRTFEIISETGPVEIQAIECANPGVQITPLGHEESPGRSAYRYQATLADTLPAGSLNTAISVQLTHNGEPRQLSINVVAVLAPPLPTP